MDQHLHRVRTKETNYKNVFLYLLYTFNARTTVVSYGRSCKNCVALRADVFKPLVSLASCLRDFLVKFQV
jgi:hypothetical protein